MNAIEMAVKAMLEKSLPGLMERLLTNLPPEVEAGIGQLGQIVVSTKAQLDRIEARLIRIENHLTSVTQEPDDVRSKGTAIPPVRE